MAAPRIHDLAAIIDELDRLGRLVRITSEVDPKLDLAGIAAEFEGGPRAVLFEKVKGHTQPVFTGLYWNRELLADLLRKDERTLPQYVSGCIRKWQRDPVEPVVVDSGPVLEVTDAEVDLYSLPVPVHALKDGGPYFDAAVVIARDPETGVRNASIQRFQIVNKNTLHVNIDSGRHLETYLEKAKKLGKSLWFTLNCGVGPGLHFAASTPAEAAPIDKDELGIASEFHGAPLQLVKSKFADAEMVAHAMHVLECEMIPGELGNEGPFAEVTNYYAKVAPRPVVHVRAIHRRRNPVFHTILSGVEVWNSVGLLGEANVLSLLQQQVPGVQDVYFSHGGCGFYHCVVQMAQKRAGWSKQAILAAFAAFPPLKLVTIVDDDVDLRDSNDVEWAMATRLDPKHGIVVLDKVFGHGLNPSFPDYLGPKVGFDATRPYPHTQEYDRASYKPMSLETVKFMEKEIVRPEIGDASVDVPAPAPLTRGKLVAWAEKAGYGKVFDAASKSADDDKPYRPPSPHELQSQKLVPWAKDWGKFIAAQIAPAAAGNPASGREPKLVPWAKDWAKQIQQRAGHGPGNGAAQPSAAPSKTPSIKISKDIKMASPRPAERR